MTVMLLDIDNCIADDSWRLPRIEWEKTSSFDRFHVYHMLAAFDDPTNQFLYRHKTHRIFVMTSRPEHYRSITEYWLRKVGVKFEHVFMRRDRDERPSEQVKLSQLRRLLNTHNIGINEIAEAYDDMPEVISMYRRSGIAIAMRMAAHDLPYLDPRAGCTKQSIEESV